MPRTIVVKSGDTLANIAARYFGDTALVTKIASYNGITNPDLLRAGERLEIPTRRELDGSKQMLPPSHGGVSPPDGLDGIVATFGDLSSYNRPARRKQLKERLPGVKDVESAKQLITYTDPANPLSLFGRWDLG